MRKVKISALGCYVPPRVLTNHDLEKMVETNNQWILERTGIASGTSPTPAWPPPTWPSRPRGRRWQQRGMDPAGAGRHHRLHRHPGHVFPLHRLPGAERPRRQRRLGLRPDRRLLEFRLRLDHGAHLVAAGTHKKVLVIGADTMSRIIDYTDRATCVLFGDGAGAMLIEPSGAEERQRLGFIDFLGEIDGSGGDYLKMPAGGSRLPASVETVDQRLHYVHQDGQQVFKYAVRKMYEVCRDLLARNGLTGEDVVVMIPHQANRRIITATAERLGIWPARRCIINIDRYGNTTAATIPLATRDAIAERHG